MDNEKPHSVSISHSQVQVVPSATGATMTITGALPTPAVAKEEKALTCHLSITHDAVGVPAMMLQARRHIVLHAAYYPKYGMDQQGRVLWKAMKNNPELHLTAIFTDVRNAPWAEEFARIMRPFYTAEEFQADLDYSKRHFTRCLKEFGPERVSIIDTSRLPLFPVIMIDNTLVVGHYAHSVEIAPDGLWLTIRHPKISLMYESLLAGNSPYYDAPEEIALIRYIHELIVEPEKRRAKKAIPAKTVAPVKTATPAKQLETVKQPASVKPSEPVKLEKPAKPVKPTAPVKLAKPTKVAKPHPQPVRESAAAARPPRPLDIGNEILKYVNRVRPLLSDYWKPRFILIWDNIIKMSEVEKEVYKVGRQRNTNFNRRLVASILHDLDRYGAYRGAFNASRMARCLEGDISHPVRAALSEYPPKDIKACIDRMMEIWRHDDDE